MAYAINLKNISGCPIRFEYCFIKWGYPGKETAFAASY